MALPEPEIVGSLIELAAASDLDVRALALAALHYAAGEEDGGRQAVT